MAAARPPTACYDYWCDCPTQEGRVAMISSKSPTQLVEVELRECFKIHPALHSKANPWAFKMWVQKKNHTFRQISCYRPIMETVQDKPMVTRSLWNVTRKS